MALAITLLLSFNQLQSHTQSYAKQIDDELEVMGSGVARRVLETAELLSYDERTTPGQWLANGGVEPNITDYESAGAFGNVPACDLDEPVKNTVDCDDIDDLDMGTTWQDIPFVFPNGDSLYFEANVRVHYVSPADLDTPLSGSSKSEYKLLIVKLRSDLHTEQGRYTNGFITFSRVFNYTKDIAEARAAAGP